MEIPGFLKSFLFIDLKFLGDRDSREIPFSVRN